MLVTYNGKSYDAPLIDTRYRLRRQRNPLERLHHLDLLHGARSLWKLRLESCRLMKLEHEILGLEREGDLPGELIPTTTSSTCAPSKPSSSCRCSTTT